MKSANIKSIQNLFCTATLFLGSTLFVNAQDVHFSQQFMAPLLLNPALAGANYANQASLIYKDQWKAADARFTTIYAGYDTRIKEKKDQGFMAAGLSFFSDKAGDPQMKTNYVNLSLGYHVKLDKKMSLGLAVQPSFGSRSLDLSSLKWGTQFDGAGFNSTYASGEPSTYSNRNYFDLNSGIIYTYKSSEHYMTANDQLAINLGFSVNHILQPDYSFYSGGTDKLKRKYCFFTNALIGIPNTKFYFMPALYLNIQGPQKEILAGTYYRYLLQYHSVYTGIKKGSAFSFGTFYRIGDAFVAKALLEYSHYAIGFAYDLNLSSYTAASKGRGGFEICLRYVSPNPFGHTVGKSRI